MRVDERLTVTLICFNLLMLVLVMIQSEKIDKLRKDYSRQDQRIDNLYYYIGSTEVE